ncbi:leucine-rich repeat protein [Plasmodium brasilianum]|uniref:Leucine-rich repeat protein n=3 Tax=Plasmodium (Plasmodium) TaxID=418103 RepID=A0A1A8W7N1_PLAMA|nr:leucine-rich repeat protein [Plasmodium malariae]KAI4836320.1 leucine-rich repeat protein [Plasmodium brasilianum]SBS87694.1 leucine-rich repeat protein (LRR4.1) [Plasmodium malariae]SCO93583.1 leucine-rich repeat protein [Plasmodium malariae]
MDCVLSNQEIKKIVERNEAYYSVIELNDVLYLNNKFYRKIESLQNLQNLKTLYLNNNALESICGLDCCVNLIALYLNCNRISKIENLHSLKKLRILNLEDNNICEIENLDNLKNLEDLNLSNNCLGSKGSSNIVHLRENKKISILNISNNQINDDILDNLTHLENLSILYLMNNPILVKYKNYRKLFVYTLNRLTFLDYKPIKMEERRCVEAFFEGGLAKEMEEMEKIKKEKKTQHENSIECTISKITYGLQSFKQI